MQFENLRMLHVVANIWTWLYFQFSSLHPTVRGTSHLIDIWIIVIILFVYDLQGKIFKVLICFILSAFVVKTQTHKTICEQKHYYDSVKIQNSNEYELHQSVFKISVRPCCSYMFA